MNTLDAKPAPFICPDCGSLVEAIPHPFKSGWIERRDCSACFERAETLKAIDRIEAGLYAFLSARGFTPRLLKEAEISQVPEKLKSILNMESAYIYGPVGTGKSCLFAAAAKQTAVNIFAHARSCAVVPSLASLPQFVNVSNLFHCLQQAVAGKGDGTYDEILKPCLSSPSLVLDDIGTRRSTEFSEDVLYEIIETRSSFLRRTFFTSNFSLAELAKKIEPRTASRIAGMCTGSVIFLGGSDRRLKPRTKPLGGMHESNTNDEG